MWEDPNSGERGVEPRLTAGAAIPDALCGGAEPGVLNNRQGLRAGWRLLMWASIVFGFFILLTIAAAVGYGIWMAAHHTSSASMTTLAKSPQLNLALEPVAFAIVFGAAVIMARGFEHRPTASLGLGFHPTWSRQLAQGLLLGLAALSAVMLVLWLCHAYRFDGFGDGASDAVIWALAYGAAFLCLALFEEFANRGYLLQTLVQGIGWRGAAAVSCLVFTLPHAANAGENPIGLLGVLAAGVVLVVLVLRTRSLWMAVGFHAAWDWAQSFLFSVPDSGFVLPHGLLRTTTIGPSLLTGGADGPEGSLVALLALAALTVYVVRARWVRPDVVAADLWDRWVERRPAAPVAPRPPNVDLDLVWEVGN